MISLGFFSFCAHPLSLRRYNCQYTGTLATKFAAKIENSLLVRRFKVLKTQDHSIEPSEIKLSLADTRASHLWQMLPKLPSCISTSHSRPPYLADRKHLVQCRKPFRRKPFQYHFRGRHRYRLAPVQQYCCRGGDFPSRHGTYNATLGR